jgi:hypothetical protein
MQSDFTDIICFAWYVSYTLFIYGSHIRVGQKRKIKIEGNPIDIFTFIDSLL